MPTMTGRSSSDWTTISGHGYWFHAGIEGQDRDGRHRRSGQRHDDLAVESVIKGPDDRWYVYYTGATVTDDGTLLQQIGLATSDDLYTWDKNESNPVVRADSRWYEELGGPPELHDEHWRDPWVFPDPDGNGWHMLITARTNIGPLDERGVIGHAHSTDLQTWTVQPPLTNPGNGFEWLEVPQVEIVDGRTVLIFNSLPTNLGASRRWARSTPAASGPHAARTYSGLTISPPRHPSPTGPSTSESSSKTPPGSGNCSPSETKTTTATSSANSSIHGPCGRTGTRWSRVKGARRGGSIGAGKGLQDMQAPSPTGRHARSVRTGVDADTVRFVVYDA
jgi:hypothetical protein